MTNRREFLKHTGLGGAMLAAWPALARSSAEAPAPSAQPKLAFTTPPSLQHPTPTAVTVAIGVNQSSTAWVEYGDTEKLGYVASGARHGLKPFDALAHHIPLEGLEAGQRCFYRVHACAIDFRNAYDIRRGDTVATDVFNFRTLDPVAKEARFAVWNDTHENADTMAQLMALTAKQTADFHVWNGDITNDNYREDKMVEHYVGAGGQPFTRDTPLLFVRGNHDTRGPAGRLLPRFQETPQGRFYYGFRHGPLAGVVLDTGEDKPDTTAVYAGLGDFVAYHRAQTAWLEAELQQAYLREAPFRVAFLHIPLWWGGKRAPSDVNDPRYAWHELFAKAGFCAVISGHTHKHGCFAPDKDRPYAQLIGGGPKPEAATLIRGVVTAEELTLTMNDLQGQELARWRTGR